MKNHYLLLLLGLLLIANCAAAQTINISGSIKTQEGDPLHFAFVQDKQYKTAAYTDSLGNFSLTVNPNSTLRINCRGFKDTLISVNNKTTFTITMRPAVNILANKSGTSQPSDRNNNINMANFRDEILFNPHFTPTPGVTPGTVVGAEGSVVGTPGYAGPVDPTTGKTEMGVIRGVTQTGVDRPVVTNQGPDMAQGAIFPQFTHKEATQGSRYLFNSWVHGYVINSKDSLIQNPILSFNYDKIDGNLLLSKDKHAAIAVYKDQIKSFTLVDDLNQQYTFTLVPAIDKTHYVEVIASGNNYSIYKLTKTEFIKANYTSDGVMSTGNYYDEFADEKTYYVIGKNGDPQKITLKKKSLKEAFNGDPKKLNEYFSNNDGDIDDNYLKDMGDYMNK